LIGRSPLRISHVLGVTALTAGWLCAAFVTHPSPALASARAVATATPTADHAVTFDDNGSLSPVTTDADTVGDFLRAQNIAVGSSDYVDPQVDVPISDGLIITYRPAVGLTIAMAGRRTTVRSSAENVGALLDGLNIRLSPDDRVQPALTDALSPGEVVRIVLRWRRTEKRRIPFPTLARLDFSLTGGTSRVLAKGASGVREDHVLFTQSDNGDVVRTVLSSRVLRKPKARIVAEDIDQRDAFGDLEARGIERSVDLAQRALEMVATAYTADCIGCSGITAIGRPAGHGIVAVDPSVIPLGTHLFIPGYGLAIAGDTGGSIHGNRIDLGFNSLRDAMLFGRREITVYRLGNLSRK
jgi:3D (Asp-Asp-Asp) domain-containing protein